MNESGDFVGLTPSQTARLTGFVMAFFAFCFLLGLTESYLENAPFKGHALKRTKAVITSSNPGTSKYVFRTFKGYYHHYRFVLSTGSSPLPSAGEGLGVRGSDYTGQFFVRRSPYFQVGQEIEVEYRPDDPSINRRAHDSDTGFNLGITVFAALLFGGLFAIGLFMLYTGKDLKKAWD